MGRDISVHRNLRAAVHKGSARQSIASSDVLSLLPADACRPLASIPTTARCKRSDGGGPDRRGADGFDRPSGNPWVTSNRTSRNLPATKSPSRPAAAWWSPTSRKRILGQRLLHERHHRGAACRAAPRPPGDPQSHRLAPQPGTPPPGPLDVGDGAALRTARSAGLSRWRTGTGSRSVTTTTPGAPPHGSPTASRPPIEKVRRRPPGRRPRLIHQLAQVNFAAKKLNPGHEAKEMSAAEQASRGSLSRFRPPAAWEERRQPFARGGTRAPARQMIPVISRAAGVRLKPGSSRLCHVPCGCQSHGRARCSPRRARRTR